MTLKQFRLFPESSDQSRTTSHPTQRSFCMATEFSKILRTKIRQFMMLPVPPQVFDRIELRSIGGKTLKLKPSVCTCKKLSDQFAPMRRRAIPDHQQVPFDMSHQMLQKKDHFRASYCTRKQSEIEVPPSYTRNRRKCSPVEVILNDWRLSPWRPCTASMRTFTKTALINKDYCSSLSLSVFFNSGHRFFFQRRIFSSSRSSARPTGR